MTEQSQKITITNIKNKFILLVDEISRNNWKQFTSSGLQSLNIKIYNVEKLSPKKIKSMYNNIVQKYYFAGKIKEQWLENELRIYVWLLICYSDYIKKSLQQFGQVQWNTLSSYFLGKSSEYCQFQYLLLKKNSLRIQRWTKEQDELLLDIMKQYQKSNKWNRISRKLFSISNHKYFKTSKQCRQRWLNYLDPTKIKGAWTIQQDYFIVDFVLKKGKRWALIAKQLENKRTEHMIKNRYKSLVAKELKIKKIQKSLIEIEVLNKIHEKLKNQFLIETKNILQKNQANKIKIPAIQIEGEGQDSQNIQYQVYQNQVPIKKDDDLCEQEDEDILYQEKQQVIEQNYSLLLSNQEKLQSEHQVIKKNETLLSTLDEKYRYVQFEKSGLINPSLMFARSGENQFLPYKFMSDQKIQEDVGYDFNYFDQFQN